MVGIEILAHSDQMIYALIYSQGEPDWLLTAVYGSPEASDRKGLWQSLSAASNFHRLPWLVLGDFNQVISSDEKLGRTGVSKFA